MCKLLKGATRVVVTHALQYVSRADYVLVMHEGAVVERGTWRELVEERRGTRLVSMLETLRGDTAALAAATAAGDAGGGGGGGGAAGGAAAGTAIKPPPPAAAAATGVASLGSPCAAAPLPAGSPPASDAASGKQTVREARQRGRLQQSVFMTYVNAIGGRAVAGIILLGFAATQATSLGSSAWLSLWSSSVNDATPLSTNMWYLGVFAGISASSLVLLVVLRVYIAFVGVRASRVLHDGLLRTLLHTPVSFMDTTPLGRILNRCSQDVYVVDENLPDTYSSFFTTFMTVAGTVVLVVVVTPWFLAGILPLAAFYIFTQQYYVSTSRELQRLDSMSRSPIYAHFGESIAGVVTLRAFPGAPARFVARNAVLLQSNQAANYMYTTSNRWLAVRLETVSTVITGAAALLAVVGRIGASSSFAALAGLSISTALALTQTLNWLVRMASDAEAQTVSVERIKEYTDLPVEATTLAGNDGVVTPPASWPARGAINITDLRLKYRPTTPYVLHGVSAAVGAGEHVGIVGRTGAGKSSLISAFFCTADVQEGVIELDGVNIAHVPLSTLRSRITLIPQTPVLFSGTVRHNLDVTAANTDDAVWEALEQAGMAAAVRALPGGLAAKVAEGGANFSVGQRQLLTVARALLRRTKLVILDEATASVDVQSDSLLQRVIREAFGDATVLTIAHRVHTIIDSSRVMVLEGGRLAEYAPPATLMAARGSLFASLVADSAAAADASTASLPGPTST